MAKDLEFTGVPLLYSILRSARHRNRRLAQTAGRQDAGRTGRGHPVRHGWDRRAFITMRAIAVAARHKLH
jgi:hypothetical protein